MLLVLGMPYPAPLALLVAVLHLVPLVGATLGGALLVIVGLFVEPWKAVVLLIFVLVYQQSRAICSSRWCTARLCSSTG